jgi:hypothetical protein
VTVDRLRRDPASTRRRGLRVVPLSVPNPGDAASWRCRAEHALLVTGSLTDSRQLFGAAYRAAELADQPEELALAALGLGGIWVHEHRSAAECAAVRMRQADALARLGRRGSVAARLTARLAAESDYVSGEHGAILRAVEVSDGERDPVGRAEALSLTHHCLLGPDHVARRLGLADELLSTAARTGRRFDVLMGLYWRTADLFLAGDLRAERSLAELRAALEETGHLAIGFAASAFEVTRALRAGDFDKAERLAHATTLLGDAAGDEDATGWFGGQLAAIRWYQGRIGELRPMFSKLVESPTLAEVDVACTAALAVAAAAAGDQRQAVCALSSLGPRQLPRLVRSSSWLVAMAGVIEASDALHDAETAAVAYRLLLPFAGLPMTASLAAACLGSVDHALGVASLTVGAADRAVHHLRAGARANEALGHWPATVLSQQRLSAALTIRGREEDMAEAARLRAVVEAESRRLGMLTPPRPTPAMTTGGRSPLVLGRIGRRWRVQQGSAVAEIDDCIGMRYLGRLIANPDTDIPAADLVASAGEGSLARGTGTIRPGADGPAGRAGRALPQPILDRAAASAYRARLSRLDSDIAEAEADNDLGRNTSLRAERRWLLDELGRTAGLGGRSRAFADDSERARSAVAKAIRRAIDRVSRADPALAARLRSQVQTGLVCRFSHA